MRGSFGVYKMLGMLGKKTQETSHASVREVIFYSMFAHANIARVVAAEVDEKTTTIVMEHGTPLTTWIATTHASARTARFVDIFSGLCDALWFLHSNGVVHGDIKPSNIIIASVAKFIDFGNSQNNPENYTDTNTTYDFVSPNALKYGEYGPQCDMYALGITMIYYFTRRYMNFQSYDDAFAFYTHTAVDIRAVPRSCREYVRRCLDGRDANEIFGTVTAGRTHRVLPESLTRIAQGEDVEIDDMIINATNILVKESPLINYN